HDREVLRLRAEGDEKAEKESRGPTSPGQVDRAHVEPLLWRTELLAGSEEGRLVALVAVRVEGDAPPTLSPMAQPAQVGRTAAQPLHELLARFPGRLTRAPLRVRLDVRVDVAECALEPNVEPRVSARVVLLGVGKDA